MTGKTPDYTKRAIKNYLQKNDRIQLVLPAGYKEKIKAHTQESFNAYIKRLIDQDLQQ